MGERLNYRRMTDDIRAVIDRMYNEEGREVPEIAEAVGLHETSIYRELNRGLTTVMGKHGSFVYDPAKARLDAAMARRNKGRKKPEGDGRCKRHAEQ